MRRQLHALRRRGGVVVVRARAVRDEHGRGDVAHRRSEFGGKVGAGDPAERTRVRVRYHNDRRRPVRGPKRERADANLRGLREGLEEGLELPARVLRHVRHRVEEVAQQLEPVRPEGVSDRLVRRHGEGKPRQEEGGEHPEE